MLVWIEFNAIWYKYLFVVFCSLTFGNNSFGMIYHLSDVNGIDVLWSVLSTLSLTTLHRTIHTILRFYHSDTFQDQAALQYLCTYLNNETLKYVLKHKRLAAQASFWLQIVLRSTQHLQPLYINTAGVCRYIVINLPTLQGCADIL